MDSKSRVPVWVSILATTAAAGLLVVAGCALDKNGGQPAAVFERVGGHSGQILEPKRCMLKVAIISRPFGDPVINEVIWRVADEQIIQPVERRAWESNGLRAGVITGEFPLELETILKDTTPGKVINPYSFFPEPGEQQLIRISETVEQASLLLNRDNRAFGKDFNDASGYFRVTLGHHGTHGVSLRFVPEIHHGPIQRNFQAIASPSPLATQELRINDGQQEETLRELPVNLVVEPGQAVVIGCYPEQKRVLGHLFFTQSVAHSDQREQKIILIWASRNLEGVVEEHTSGSDRPNLFKRLMGPSSKRVIPKTDTQPPAPLAIPDLPRINEPTPTPVPSTTPATTTTVTNTNATAPGSKPASKSTGAPAVPTSTSTDKSDQTP